MTAVRVALDRSIRHLSTGVEWVTILLTAVLVLVVTTNVVARYVFQVGLLYAEEVSRLTFVWVVFLGAFLALRRHVHLSLTFVFDRMPEGVQRVVRVVGVLLVLALLAVLMWAGARLVLQTIRFGRVTPILGISAAWGYVSVPLSAALMFLEVVRQALMGDLDPSPVDDRPVAPPESGAGAAPSEAGTSRGTASPGRAADRASARR